MKQATGYSIGAVPPLGHLTPLRTVFDETLLDLPVVWAAAGSATAVFAIEPAELARLTGAEILPIGPADHLACSTSSSTRGGGVPVVRRGDLRGRAPSGLATRRRVLERADRGRRRIRIGRREVARRIRPHLAEDRDVADHDRRPGGHRLDQRDAEALVERRVHERERLPEQLGVLVRR